MGNIGKPIGGNGLYPVSISLSGDATNGHYLDCNMLWCQTDLSGTSITPLEMKMPVDQNGLVNVALPWIQQLINQPPLTAPGSGGMPSLPAFLEELQSYMTTHLIPA
jgi:hypothetical protein